MSQDDIKKDLIVVGILVILSAMLGSYYMAFTLGRGTESLGIGSGSAFESYLVFIIIFAVTIIPVGALSLAGYRKMVK